MQVERRLRAEHALARANDAINTATASAAAVAAAALTSHTPITSSSVTTLVNNTSNNHCECRRPNNNGSGISSHQTNIDGKQSRRRDRPHQTQTLMSSSTSSGHDDWEKVRAQLTNQLQVSSTSIFFSSQINTSYLCVVTIDSSKCSKRS
jgi:hypothetical protein